jgi:3-oxoacyl-[acyl-carrier protein] reductase
MPKHRPEAVAKEFAHRTIRVNGVKPGFVLTEETHAVANTPLGRAGQPADIVGPVAFLAFDDAN